FRVVKRVQVEVPKEIPQVRSRTDYRPNSRGDRFLNALVILPAVTDSLLSMVSRDNSACSCFRNFLSISLNLQRQKITRNGGISVRPSSEGSNDLAESTATNVQRVGTNQNRTALLVSPCAQGNSSHL